MTIMNPSMPVDSGCITVRSMSITATTHGTGTGGTMSFTGLTGITTGIPGRSGMDTGMMSGIIRIHSTVITTDLITGTGFTGTTGLIHRQDTLEEAG